MELSESELMRRTVAGDSSAYEELVRRFELPLQRFLWGMLSDEEEARDVAQDAFMQAFRNREKFNQAMSFKTWLFTIARNRAISVLRRRRFQPISAEVESHGDDGPSNMLEQVPDDATNPRENLVIAEDARWLRRALERLDERHRTVLEMKYLGGMRSREIADVLGLEVGTVWSRVHHGLKKLKALSAEMNYER